jgi:putative NADH-flavin reductase
MKITIMGASGNVGSCAAFNIAARGLADELVLIDDPRPDMVAMHALDINTAVTGLDMMVRAGSAEDMNKSDIVVIAAGSAQVVASRLASPQTRPSSGGSLKVKILPDAVVITATILSAPELHTHVPN